MPDRPHDVSDLTGPELERAGRELAVSLALVHPGSPAQVPIMAQMSTIETELASRAAGAATVPEPVIYLCSCGFGTDDRDWIQGHLTSTRAITSGPPPSSWLLLW